MTTTSNPIPCYECGAELREDYNFCPNCGHQVADEVEVLFPDKNLEAAVLETIERPEGPLTRGDLKRLVHLCFTFREIEDLSSLEHAINLTELSLGENEIISDVSPLPSLTNLTKLDLYGNQVSDVSPLDSLTELTKLWLNNNPFRDVSSLDSLTNLTGLDLNNNEISDVGPLASLTELTWLCWLSAQMGQKANGDFELISRAL